MRDLAGISSNGDVDVAALFEQLKEEVRRSGAAPGEAGSGDERLAARAEAERLWPVSADRSLRLRPGVRGGLGTPAKAVLRKLMRWYVEPLAYDQRSFNAAALRLIDDLEARVAQLEAELTAAAALDEDRRLRAAGAVRARRRRDLRGHARRRAARARPRGRARHRPVQVVPGHARARPGVPLAAARPDRVGRAADRPASSRRSSPRTASATRTSASGCCTSSGRRTSSTEPIWASSPKNRRTGRCGARSNGWTGSRSARRSGSSRPRATSPTGSSARPGSRPR